MRLRQPQRKKTTTNYEIHSPINQVLKYKIREKNIDFSLKKHFIKQNG